MSDIDIRRLDFSLLLVFLELVHHRKSTRVAERLGLTQSSISHALGRLRAIFGDELFVRRQTGLEPTARALELEPEIRAIVEMARQAVSGDAKFDPASAEGTVRVGAFDYDCALFAPALVARMRELAPGLTVSFRPFVRRPALDALASGDLDLALGYFWGAAPGITIEPLFEETYTVITRLGHRLGKLPSLSLEAFTAAEHVLVSYDGDSSGIVDKSLQRLGRSRQVVATVPFFFPALALVSTTDVIATVPRRLALGYAEAFGLRSFEPPLPIRPFQVSLAIHRRRSGSASIAWLASQLRAGQG